MLAPPWIPVPPPGYGGIEAVVALLCDELVARGHDVTLFAAPGSHSAAQVCSPLEGTHADQIGSSLYEADHVGSAYDAIDASRHGGSALRSSCTITRASPRSRWRTTCRCRSCTRCTPRSTMRRVRSTRVTVTRPGSWRSATFSSSTRRPACASPMSCPTRFASRTGRFSDEQGRLPAVDGADGPGEGRAPRNRGGASGRHPARARGTGAARAGGVLPPRDRAARRRPQRSSSSVRSAAYAARSCSRAQGRF